MSKRKSKAVSESSKSYKKDSKPNPRNAKIVLFLFGIGPLILMSYFLFTNGFFNSAN